ncbi:galactose 1-dehydrogenase [Sphingopyxis sp. Root214]|uniref:Gfo/Idh/MocA family protein n=1 Tax=unclassified Sphingopyxis TaxID=2614943 RepID=UPI0006F6B375|nr:MULTISPECIES: Gfo/Idh/MocA family oxidoreductase [unclassified Sphingopyxis]KQZ77039.1 galactose 1-dehydrogenase [Sphingopyxis sp. Root154]KRC09075.1 galactose 1-dehydrogenase [Sphingopyxis sp. Root214]
MNDGKDFSRGSAGTEIRLALFGIGKIARDQHLPAIAADPRFRLAATASRNDSVDGVPGYRDIDDLLAAGVQLDAVALCTPPEGRADIARRAIDAGLHVMLEKPPGVTADEVRALARHAAAKGVTLFASWHSREAAAVDSARDWLSGRVVTGGRIIWKENIRQWHPGQEWILERAGMGVFDPAINALSILTRILPARFDVEAATLDIPSNRSAAIAAACTLRSAEGYKIEADLDFLFGGAPSWDIEIATDAGRLILRDGGATVELPGAAPNSGENCEYPRLYGRFHALVEAAEIEADTAPLELVEQAYRVGEARAAPPFAF